MYDIFLKMFVTFCMLNNELNIWLLYVNAGGSISNMYGMNLARYQKYPEVKEEGMSALPRICLFTSEQVILYAYGMMNYSIITE